MPKAVRGMFDEGVFRMSFDKFVENGFRVAACPKTEGPNINPRRISFESEGVRVGMATEATG
jgi:hypothetical protein